MKKEEKGFDAIDVILNVTNFLKMEGDLENDTKNEKSKNKYEWNKRNNSEILGQFVNQKGAQYKSNFWFYV